jgi:hypothetical protein
MFKSAMIVAMRASVKVAAVGLLDMQGLCHALESFAYIGRTCRP